MALTCVRLCPVLPHSNLVWILAVSSSLFLRAPTRYCLVTRAPHVWPTRANLREAYTRRPMPLAGLARRLNVHLAAAGTSRALRKGFCVACDS